MYLSLQRISVHGANALCSAHAIGYPSITAFAGLANTICRSLGDSIGEKLFVARFCVIHHASQMRDHGRSKSITYKKAFYAGAKPVDDNKMFNPPGGLQPQMNLTFSLLIETRDGHAVINDEMLLAATPPRALGGVVHDVAAAIANLSAAPPSPSGWVVVDQTHLLSDIAPTQEFEEYFKLILNGRQPVKNGEDRPHAYAPMQIGFRAISPLKRREGQRDDSVDHAFVEPVLGLVRFVPHHELTTHAGLTAQAYWTSTIDRSTGLFLNRGAK